LCALSRNVTTEGIHQARISIRRLRVALRAMKHQLRPSRRRRYLLALRDFASDLEQAREADARVALVGKLITHNSLAHRGKASRLRTLLAAQSTEARLRAQPDCHSIASKLNVMLNTRQARLLKIIGRLSHDMCK
jgi:CHAD domain-containing protein